MTVIVNGQPQEVPEGTTVQELIRRLGLDKAACAAELNRRLIPKRDHAAKALTEGDTIELVSLVGGG